MAGKQKLREADKYLALVNEMHKMDASRTNVTQEQQSAQQAWIEKDIQDRGLKETHDRFLKIS